VVAVQRALGLERRAVGATVRAVTALREAVVSPASAPGLAAI